MKIEQYLALSILSYSKSLSSFASSSGEPSIEALIKQGKIDNYRHSDGSTFSRTQALLLPCIPTTHQRYNLQNKKNNSMFCICAIIVT